MALTIFQTAVELSGSTEIAFYGLTALCVVAILSFAIVVRAYWELSICSSSPGLRRGAVGTFGALILLEVENWCIVDGPGHWWNVVLWIALGLALGIVTVAVIFLETVRTDSKNPPPAPDTASVADPSDAPLQAASGAATETPTTSWWSRTTTAAVRGIGAVAVVAVGRSIFWAVNRGVDYVNLIELVVVFLTLVVAVVFVAWFAAAKIRLRKVLGIPALLVGLVELLTPVIFVAILVGWVVAAMLPAQQTSSSGSPTDQGEEATTSMWLVGSIVAWIVIVVVWGSLTATLLLQGRRRLARRTVPE
jgi:Ca2+/Na+ antiporter